MLGPALIFIIILILLPTYFYSRHFLTTEVGTRIRWFLSFARIALLIVVFWLTFRPSTRTEELVRTPNRLFVLLDNSASMLLDADNFPGSDSRLDTVKRTMFGRGNIFDEFKDKGWEVNAMVFSGDRFVAQEEDYEAPLPYTDIKGAIEKAGRSADNPDTDAILLVSDGCHNEGQDPVQSAEAVPVRIWTLGVGPDEMPTDSAVTNLSAPDFVFQNETFQVRATAEASPDIDSATLLLFVGEQIIESATVNFEAGQATRDFDLELDALGEKVLKATIISEMKESVTENDSMEKTVKVSKSKMRGIILWGTPDWELRFMERALREDRRLVVTALSALPQRRTLIVTPEQEQDPDEMVRTQAKTENRPIGDILISQLSSSIDWIILGDLEAEVLGAKAIDALSDWVSEAGGGLLCTGGPNAFVAGGYRGTSLESMLPVSLPEQSGYRSSQPSITLTEKGAQFIPFAAAMTSSEFPPLQGGHLLGEAKPGATVLFEFADMKSPAVAVQRFGLGQVMTFAGYGTWSWQMYRRSGGDIVSHGQFWRALINYLQAEPGTTGIQIETDSKIYERSELADVWLYVPASISGASRESNIDLSVIDPEGEVDILSLSLQRERSGLYSGRYEFAKSGQYRFQLSFGTNQIERNITVNEPRREFNCLVKNQGLLKSIASASGGEYFPQENRQELLDAIPLVKQEHRQVRWVLWAQKPWMIMLLLVLLASEWLIRRRVGLP